ncbi:MAG: hypothetical protein GXP45_07155 [bacterium]|nr:hypothetical protein [bacterium]
MDIFQFKENFDKQMRSYIQKKIELTKSILAHPQLNYFADYFLDYVFQ